SRLGSNALVMQIPIGAEENFKGVVDLITMKAVYWNDADQGLTFELQEPPAELADLCAEYREKLVESAAEATEELTEKYWGGEELIADDMHGAIRQRGLAGEVVAALCGTEFKSEGVEGMSDAVIRYLPGPDDVESIRGELPNGEAAERHTSEDEPFAALAYK